MLLRSREPSFFTVLRKLLWPALALGTAAVVLGRISRPAPPMPRLPVRRKPSPSSGRLASSSRRRRLSAPPVEVALPNSFWEVSADEDDPAEIPGHSSSFVSEASQSAAGVAPGAFYDPSVPVRW